LDPDEGMKEIVYPSDDPRLKFIGTEKTNNRYFCCGHNFERFCILERTFQEERRKKKSSSQDCWPGAYLKA
jgi:hypothetical protein